MKLSRTEVVELLNLDLIELKEKFRKKKIKSQKRRSIESWGKLLEICEVNIPEEK